MTIVEPGAGGANLVDRVRAILLTPKEEWPKIAAEPASVQSLYMGYALPLMALAAICGVIGWSVFGYSAFGATIRLPLMSTLIGGVLQFGLGIASLFVLGLIINALAPSFGSRQEPLQAHKLAVYGATAGMLAGVFTIYPPLAFLGLLGLYSIVLLYLGLPRLLGTPEDKRVGYLATIIILAIVAGVVMAGVSDAVRRATGGGALAGAGWFSQSRSAPDINVTLPDGTRITANENAASPEMSITAPGGASVELGATPGATVDAAALQALLPESLPGGFQRTAVSSAVAMGATQAQGTYVNGDRTIELQIMHMGAMASLGGLSASMGITSNSETANGYERIRSENGRTITESLDRSSGRATWGVITASGVAIQVDGQGVSPEQVQAAAAAVPPERIEALAR